MYRHIEPPKNFGFSQLHKKPEFAKMNAEKAKLQIKNPKSGFGTASLNRFKREHQGMTPSELTLWSNPRFRDLNPIPQDSRFRYTEGWGNGTQGPTLDFSIPNFNLNIEIDGWGHTKESDEERDKFLDEKGWTVLRFTNDQVKTNDNKVVDQIHNYINILSLVL
jgi:very-short-patch-repair endonuclease